MLVLTILGIIAAFAAIIALLVWFNKKCYDKFDHSFFSFISIISAAAAIALMYGGYHWRLHSLAHAGDSLNGTILIAIGLIMALALIIYSYKRTNLLYCIVGSTLQFSLFAALTYVWVSIAIVCGIFAVLEFWGASPVRIVK